MNTRAVTALALSPLLFVLLGPSTTSAQVASQSLPSGVTEKMIADGEAIFKAQGLCFACHGQDARGMPGLGANLTDSEWIHIDGSYEKIVEIITAGTTSSTGGVMPPKGGSTISEEQVKAVAAYVWKLSHSSGTAPGR